MLMVSISSGEASATAQASARAVICSNSSSRSAAGTVFESLSQANMPIGMQDDGAGDDRAGQASPADLVDAAHAVEAQLPQDVLERACRGDASHR